MSDITVPNRKRVRAKGYDYSQPAWYFVTICTQNRLCMFGNVENGRMCLNSPGNMVSDVLSGLSKYFENVDIEPFVVMPNHIHAIVILEPLNGDRSPHTLSNIVSSFKLQTTRRYAQAVRDHGWVPFPGRLWQRSFHDHIVRNGRQAERLHEYIEANPLLWKKDTHYVSGNDQKL